MPKASPGLRSFNAGLLSPQMGARTDFDPKYQHGCSVLENFIVLVEGPVTKRPGALRIAPTKYDDRKSRIYPFELSNDQAYALEIGHEYMRVHRNQATVLDPSGPMPVEGITAANPMEFTITGHGFSDGDHVFVTGTEIEELNDQFHRVTNSTINTFEVEVDGTTLTAQATTLGTATKVYELALPYSETEIATLKFALDEDVLFTVCRTQAPRKIQRIADDNWTVGLVFDPTTFEDPDGARLWTWPPFNDTASQRQDPMTMTVSGAAVAGATVTVTCSDSLFVPTDVGRHLKLQAAALEWAYGEITAYISGTQVTLTVKSEITAALVATLPTTLWAWGAFDEVSGYPRAVALHEGRLFFAGTPEQPQHFWFSVSDAQGNFRPYGPDGSGGFTVLASSSGSRRLSGDKRNAIEWMLDQSVLYCGTRGREWTIQGTSIGEPITPANVDAKAKSSIGSRKDVRAIGIDNFILFAQRSGRKIKELAYREDSSGSDSIAGYGTRDMTRLSREVCLGRLKYWDYQQEPYRVIWCVLEDGSLASFTYENEDSVFAWANHPIGGTNAKVESVAVIPVDTDDEDEVWMTVSRTVNGVTRRSVEVIASYWTRGDSISTAVFMDSSTGLYLSGQAATSFAFIGAPATDNLVDFGVAHPFTTGDTIEVLSDPDNPTSAGALFEVGATGATTIQLLNEDGSVFVGGVDLSAAGTVFRATLSTVKGVLHLAGETIGVVVRGQVSEDVVVSSLGTFDLPQPSGECIYGLKYESRLQTMTIEGGSATGTSQGRTSRINKAVFRVDQCGQGLYAGGSFDDMDLVDLWDSQDLMDSAIPLYDGDTERFDFPDDSDLNTQIAMKHILPLPATIVGVFPIFNVQDD